MRSPAQPAWPLGPGYSLALLAALMAAAFLVAGLFLAWWLYADQDLTLAYQGLLANSHLPQEYFDHPGYWSYRLTGAWYGLLQALGWLSVSTIDAMPPASESSAAWEALVRAGRVLSLAIAIGLTGAFAALLRRLVGDWRLALLGAAAFAFSGGMILHARIMRTELIAGGLMALALMLVVIAARSDRARPVLVGLGAFAVVLALANKVQAFLPLLALPVMVWSLLLAGGAQAPADPENGRALRSAWIAIVAILLWIPAARLVAIGYSTPPALDYPALPLARFAWPLALAWLLGALAILPGRVATLSAAACGAALGVLALTGADAQVLVALTHPVEHMAAFVAWKYAAPVVQQSLIAAVPGGVGDVLMLHTIAPGFSRPTVVLEWLLVAAALAGWRRGDRALAAGVAVLLATVVALESVFALRHLKPEYFVFTEPAVIVMAALALVRLAPGESLDRALPGAALVVALIAAWGFLGSARLLFHHREPRHGINTDDVCVWAPFYLARIERLPFCPAEDCQDAGPVRACWRDGAWRQQAIVP